MIFILFLTVLSLNTYKNYLSDADNSLNWGEFMVVIPYNTSKTEVVTLD